MEDGSVKGCADEESSQLLERTGVCEAACAAVADPRPLPRALRRASYACVAFSIYGARLAAPYAWRPELYVPVLSPLYRQQEHWLRVGGARPAVAAHVTCGILMLLAIVMQLDGGTRRRWPWLHRWVGRLYALAGIGALVSLRWLRDTSGAGSSYYGDPLIASFIDAASLAWVAATAVGVDAMVRRRDKRAHSRAMLLSACLAGLPILQRLINALLLAPAATVVRSIVCLWRYGEPPWRARWGAPRGPLALLLGEPTQPADAHARAAAPAAAAAAAAAVSRLSASVADPRASPRMFSLDGYGESEQAAFGVSAWFALIVVLGGAASVAWSERRASRIHATRSSAALDAASEGGEGGGGSSGEAGVATSGKVGGNDAAASADAAAADAADDSLLRLVALGDAATLAPWLRLSALTLSWVELSRRIAGRLAGALCRCTGLRFVARAVAALLWLALLVILPIVLVAIIAFVVVAIVAILVALPMVAASAATAVPYFAFWRS